MYCTTELRIYLQNVCKNYALVDTFLESQKNSYDIFFVQEPPWNFIQHTPSTSSLEGDKVVGAPIHPDWTQVVRLPRDSESPPWVMAFIHTCLSRLRFALRRDVIDHRDILLLFFFDRNECHFLINMYSDDHHSAVKFMLDQVIDIPNLLYMGGDFNIRDAEWDPLVTSHPAAGQALMDLADSFGLVRSLLVLPVPTHYSDSEGHANSVIDLIFIDMNIAQVSHHIELDLRWPSEHAPLIVNLPITPENTRICRKVLKRNSEEESAFLSSVIASLGRLNFSGLSSTAGLDLLSSNISKVFADAWDAYARNITVTACSKKWWNSECRTVLERYRLTGDRSDWHLFRSATRSAKRSFFDNRIAEIVSTNKRPWDLMSWVKQHKLPAVEAIRYQGSPCNTLPDLWNALHLSYNAAANRPVQLSALDDVPCLAPRLW